jgi:hypothetical protein
VRTIVGPIVNVRVVGCVPGSVEPALWQCYRSCREAPLEYALIGTSGRPAGWAFSMSPGAGWVAIGDATPTAADASPCGWKPPGCWHLGRRQRFADIGGPDAGLDDVLAGATIGWPTKESLCCSTV